MAHPAQWALLYGSPVPGYHAPPEQTVGVGTRVVGAIFDAIAAGIATGDIRLTDTVAPQPMSSDFERIRHEFGFPGDDSVVAKCFLFWPVGHFTVFNPCSGRCLHGFSVNRPPRRRSASSTQWAIWVALLVPW